MGEHCTRLTARIFPVDVTTIRLRLERQEEHGYAAWRRDNRRARSRQDHFVGCVNRRRNDATKKRVRGNKEIDMAEDKGKVHPTPILDKLESGPWPSFVTGLKRLRDSKNKQYAPVMNDLLGQLEH
jgi:hypothetical protein